VTQCGVLQRDRATWCADVTDRHHISWSVDLVWESWVTWSDWWRRADITMHVTIKPALSVQHRRHHSSIVSWFCSFSNSS